MGYTYDSVIEAAARHLLTVLEQANEVPYSTFYDGTSETHDTLEKALEWDCPEHALDLAAAQLEEQGLVETQRLEDKLADEESDYLIRLTAKGRSWFTSPFDLKFYDAE